MELLGSNETNASLVTIKPVSAKPEGHYLMGTKADLAWTVVFSLMIISAILGNLVVFWIVLAHKRMQNVTNYFLVNLSLSDLMMSCLNTIFNFIFMKNRNWVFGSVYCTINNFIAYLSVAVSVFTLMAISIDRYIAIVRPLKPRMTKTSARVFLVVIWVCSGLLSLPSLLYSKTHTFASGKNTVCFLMWPDGPPPVSKQDYIYNIVYFTLTYLVPIVAMAICYGRIGKALWGKGIISENACVDIAQQRKLMSKRKVVKMFIVVVIIFAVCWLPYHVYFIYTYHHPSIVTKPFIQHVFLGFYWLAMANSMFNPFIYYWMNARFRGYFLSLVTSIRVLFCEPRRFFHRTSSKSSLNIGVIPVGRSGFMREMAHLNFGKPGPRVMSEAARSSPGRMMEAAGAVVTAATGPPVVLEDQAHSLAARQPHEASTSFQVSRHNLNCCYSLQSGGTRDPSSNEGISSSYIVKNNISKSDDALLRVAVPFRNNPVLRTCVSTCDRNPIRS